MASSGQMPVAAWLVSLVMILPSHLPLYCHPRCVPKHCPVTPRLTNRWRPHSPNIKSKSLSQPSATNSCLSLSFPPSLHSTPDLRFSNNELHSVLWTWTCSFRPPHQDTFCVLYRDYLFPWLWAWVPAHLSSLKATWVLQTKSITTTTSYMLPVCTLHCLLVMLDQS